MPESEFRHQLIGDRGEQRATEPLAAPEQKFTPADETVNWTHINALVHGPGATSRTRNKENNSAVFACLMAIATAYPEPPLTVYRTRAGRRYPIPEHPLQRLISRPVPGGDFSMEDLLFWIAWAKHTHGNAYLLKRRAGNARSGNVVELWPVSPANIRPVTPRDSDGRALAWISHYQMLISESKQKWEDVPKENIIHFRLGVDPQDRRLGISPLKRLIREIATDDEATAFTDTLLSNYAIPGLVVVPSGATVVDKASADRISETMSQKFSGENRGKVAVLSRESVIQQFGFSPEQLQMDVLHRIPEERISAVMGVPAIVAGLGAGLDRATFANFRESREMFTEQRLVPEWKQDAGRWNANLLPDFSSDRGVSIAYDLTDVRALQEDMDARYNRLNVAVQGGWVLRNEARAEVGYEPIPGWDEEDTAAFVPPPPEPEPTPEDSQDDDGEGEKRLPFGRPNGLSSGGTMLTKVSPREFVRRRQRARRQAIAQAERGITRFFDGLADAVIRAAARREPAVAAAGNGHAVAHKALTPREWATILNMIFDQQEDVLEGVITAAYLQVVIASWGILNLELGEEIQYDRNDPAVVEVLQKAGDNIRGIQQATLDVLRPLLQDAYREGEDIETIAGRVRAIVQETYSGRAKAIARTEVGRAQQLTTATRYERAGVQYVEVLDNGFDNSHPFCRKVNGKIVTLAWAKRNPIQHPNCVRAFAAVFDYDGPVFEEEETWE